MRHGVAAATAISVSRHAGFGSVYITLSGRRLIVYSGFSARSSSRGRVRTSHLPGVEAQDMQRGSGRIGYGGARRMIRS